MRGKGGATDADLIRVRQQRILALQDELASRYWHPSDPMKRELEGRIADEQNSLNEQLRWLSSRKR